MKIAYFDCFSGVSGDMFVGALLDAGCDVKALLKVLSGLPLKGYAIRIRKEKRGGFAGTRFDVAVAVGKGEKVPHSHGHPHVHGRSHPGHAHRTFPEIESILKRGKLPAAVLEKALSAFRAIAEAEGKAHGIPATKVHFHEVGAVDTIVDIVAAAAALHLMGIEAVHSSSLPLGAGHVHCEHGTVPVPAPGTMGLLKGIPVTLGHDHGHEPPGELVTPTGAALICSWAKTVGEPVGLRPLAVGYGAGKRQRADVANLLRVVIGEAEPGWETDQVYLLEANLDDVPGEWVGHAMEKLFEAGALDAFMTPVQMKKNRPGIVLSAIVAPEKRVAAEEVFFRETTTLGVRRSLVTRSKLPRETVVVSTPFGRIPCKVSTGPNGEKRFSPEYEALRKAARRTGRGLPDLIQDFHRARR